MRGDQQNKAQTEILAQINFQEEEVCPMDMFATKEILATVTYFEETYWALPMSGRKNETLCITEAQKFVCENMALCNE